MALHKVDLGAIQTAMGAVIRSTSGNPYLISDAFFLIGIAVFLVGIGGVVANSGALDIVGFSARKFMEIVRDRPAGESAVDFPTYQARKRKKHHVRWPLVCGLFCLLVSGLTALLR